MRILSAVYQSSGQLESVENDEQDANRLERLYRIDHAITRVRRQAENMQVLAGSQVEDADRQITSLLDVVRAAASAIEHYPRVHLGRIADLAIVEYASDDVMRILTELLDNATRFSPPSSRAVVSAHLTEQGSVLMRVEDAGIGLDPAGLANANALLTGPGPAPVDGAGHIGLPVIARLAATHRLRVHLTARHPGGTTATVLLPDHLLREIPDGAAADDRNASGDPGPNGDRGGSLVPLTRPENSAQRPAARRDGTARIGSPVAPVPAPVADDRTMEYQTVPGPGSTAGPSVPSHRAPAADEPNLPRRSPASLRAEPVSAEPMADDMPDRADEVPWYDDVAAFAAGAADTPGSEAAPSWPTWRSPQPQPQLPDPQPGGQS